MDHLHLTIIKGKKKIPRFHNKHFRPTQVNIIGCMFFALRFQYNQTETENEGMQKLTPEQALKTLVPLEELKVDRFQFLGFRN